MSGLGPDNPRHSGAAAGKGDPKSSLAPERLKSSATIAEELDNLYVLVRGTLYANALNEAKKTFQAQNYLETLRLVRETGELHRRTHLQAFKQDPEKSGLDKKEVQKLRDKQAKINGALKRFNELVERLEKMAHLKPLKPKAPVFTKPQFAHKPRAAPRLSEAFCAEFQAAQNGEAQFKSICEQFHATAVESEEDIKPDGLYSLWNQGQIHLIRCAQREGTPAMFTMVMVLSGKSLKPIPLEKLLEFGRKQLLHRLMPKNQTESGTESQMRQASEEARTNGSVEMMEQSKGLALCLLDMGSFSQLQTAAQQTGLLPNADAIGFVRDHEFRTKKYQEAFDRIEGLFIHLRTAAEQRAQKLRQEDLDYRSGTLKMSPKAWMLKQQRDTALTQQINRALRYFTRVLDGLRIMMTAAADAPQ